MKTRLTKSANDELQTRIEDVLAPVPGVGAALATRVRSQLGIATLAELRRATHDGSLARVPGFGQRRIEAVRCFLRSALPPSPRMIRARERGPGCARDAPVALLLDVDADYRSAVKAGTLPRIAPRRFNPAGERWLPVMHSKREGWELTVMFSNSERAHRLDTTRDWVVIHYTRDGLTRRCTVVTKYGGKLGGRRVVRGREAACTALFTARAARASGHITLPLAAAKVSPAPSKAASLQLELPHLGLEPDGERRWDRPLRGGAMQQSGGAESAAAATPSFATTVN